MKHIIRSLLTVRWVTTALMIVVTCVTAISIHAQQSMYVTGYWPTWAYPMTVEQANWTGMTHAIFFTAAPVQTAPYLNVLVTSTDSLALENNGSDVGMVGRFVAAAHSHGVKTLLCIGGIYGTQSTNMAYIASDSTRADVFATASVAYAKRRGFDGIDVDWEPPANYNDNMRLLRLLRRELNKGMTYVSRGLLTIACAEGSTSKWDPVWCNQNVDQMNLMMYDFWQLGSGICFSCDADRVGHNAALHRPDASHGTVMYNNQTNYDADEPNSPLGASTIANPRHGPRAFLKAGFSAAHLSAGIPFYGYVFNNVANLGDLRNGSNNDYTTYASILSALNAGGMTYHWDDAAKVPYLTGTPVSTVYPFNRAKPVVVTYDDTTSIRLKTEWTKQLGLGGVMIYDFSMGWVNTASPKDPLLRAVVNSVGSHVSPADTVHPLVALTTPLNGDSIVTGTSVNITAAASDNIGVARVDFLVNGTVAASKSALPWSYAWPTTGLSGAQTLTARAYDAAGNSTLSASVTVIIKAAIVVSIPVAPALSSPATGATGQSLTPTLTWNASAGAATYRLQVSVNSLFTGTPVCDDSTLTGLSKQLPVLAYGTTYYWHVKAKNSAGSGAFSTASSFTTAAAPLPAAPILASPASGSTGSTLSPTLSWNTVSGATTYRLQVSASSSFGGSLLVDDSMLTSVSRQVTGCAYSTPYYWRVCAKNSYGAGAWSAAWSYTTLPAAPPPITGDNWLYQDGIASPWVNYSWSSTNTLNSTDHVFSGTASWKTMTSAWGVISLHNGGWGTAGIVPSQYARLEFELYNATPGLTLNITCANDQGGSFPSTNLQANIPVNQWILISVPVATLDPGNLAISQMTIQNYTGSAATWYADNIRLVAKSAVPSVPVLLTPLNGATGQPVTAALAWSPSTGATSYQVEIGTDSLFTLLLMNDSSITGTSATTPILNTGTRYFWRVNAKNAAGRSAFSQAGSFVTVASAPGDLWLCRDGLENPWVNYSWGSTVTFNNPEHPYAGTTSVKSVSTPWGGVSFHYGQWGVTGVSPALVATLEFAVYTTTSNLTLNVMLANDQSGTCTQSNIQPALPVNRWTVVSIPVSQLDPNKLSISQVSIENATGLSATFYIDNVRLTGANVSTQNHAVIPSTSPGIAQEFKLNQNYPNPFNPETTVSFVIGSATLVSQDSPSGGGGSSFVSLKIYDVLGREVASLVDETRGPGSYAVKWDATNQPSGVYYCRLTAGGFTDIKRMLLVR